MSENTVTIIVAIVTALGSVVTALFGWLAKRGVNYLDKKTSVLDEASQLARKEALKNRIVEVATIAARSTMQTFVDDVKAGSADGKLTPDERKEAFRKTYTTALDILKSEGIEVGKEILTATIEAVVGGIKGAGKNSSAGEDLPAAPKNGEAQAGKPQPVPAG